MKSFAPCGMDRIFNTRTLLLLCCLALSTAFAAAQGQESPEERQKRMARIREASAADHQKMMEQLGITDLRPGANGRDTAAPNAANYDETKANPYPRLPQLLLGDNGEIVSSANEWWDKRRPEIMEHFDREIYGRVAAQLPDITWTVDSTFADTHGGFPIITRKLTGHAEDAAYPAVKVDIALSVSLPANGAKPVPVIMEFGFVFPPGFRRPAETGPDWKAQVLAKGWGFAVLLPTTVQADNGAGLASGIIGLANRGKTRKPDDWGALRAWAWGASRAMDYFETDPSIDSRKIGIEGHSRFGKAALVTMAYDQRFGIAYVSSSGAGGAKLHRRNYGELVENVAAVNEYHWMAGNYLKYAGPLTWDDLPVDAHQLIALCAPRPVFIGSGDEGDGWVDPRGMFLAGVYAGPAYRLLGMKDLGTSEFPPLETSLTAGEIAFRQHSGGHSPGPNWPAFLNFAERYFH
jgi:hypothetical protein